MRFVGSYDPRDTTGSRTPDWWDEAKINREAYYQRDITGQSADTVAPATVGDLSVVSANGFEVTLTWTAPGDDGMQGVASRSILRGFLGSAEDFSWESAEYARGFRPLMAGATETWVAQGLELNADYSFALVTQDEENNLSGLSNIVEVSTGEAEGWLNYTTANSDLADNQVNDIVVDGEGRVWCATESGGVCCFDGVGWTTYNTENSGLPSNSVLAAFVSPTDGIWFGTRRGGAARLKAGVWSVFNSATSGIAGDDIYAIDRDRSGNMWFGASAQEICRFDGESWDTWSPVTGMPGLPPGPLGSIAIDSVGDVWIGYDHWPYGVSRYNGQEWETFTESNSGLPNDIVLSLGVGRDGVVWLGGDWNGPSLSSYVNGVWSAHSTYWGRADSRAIDFS
jgi:sugar lactone lactonase YvrE